MSQKHKVRVVVLETNSNCFKHKLISIYTYNKTRQIQQIYICKQSVFFTYIIYNAKINYICCVSSHNNDVVQQRNKWPQHYISLVYIGPRACDKNAPTISSQFSRTCVGTKRRRRGCVGASLRRDQYIGIPEYWLV